MYKATLIPADEHARTQTIETNDKLTLREMQQYVGGYIELVITTGMEEMLVDEDGLSKRRPHNRRASILADKAIVGTALVLHYCLE